MLKLKRIAAFLAASTVLVSSSILAAEKGNVLANIKGEVLINQGESYTVAKEGMQLNPGDQLMVMDGGLANIEFADGCRYKVNGNEILRINTQSACAVNASKAVGPYYTQLGNTTKTKTKTKTKKEKGNNTAVKVVGGIAGASIIYLATKKDDGKTISP